MGKFDFKTSGYFSGNIMFLGIALSAIGMFTVFSSMMGGLILFIISTIIFTTHYRVAIDLGNKTYRDYLWMLGLKSGEKGKFEKIEYLFIKKSKTSQTMHLRVASSTIRKEVYDGYLKFSEQVKIHLMTQESKENLIQKLRPIASRLNTKIIDYSEGDPKEI